MFKKKWPFKEEKNVMTITTKNFVIKGNLILHVTHDDEDGMWQFHDGLDVNVDDGMIMALEEVFDLDRSISEIVDLPLGWIAWRNSGTDPWKRQKHI